MMTRRGPPDGGWGWVVVFCSFMNHLLLEGCVRSFGLIYLQLLDRYQAGSTATTWLHACFNALQQMGIGPFLGILVERFACRKLTIVGGFVFSMAYLMSAFAPNIYFLYFSYSIVGGLGSGLIYSPIVIIVNDYFSKKRGQAMGLAALGAAVGTFVMPPLILLLFHQFGYTGCLMILSALGLNHCVFAAFYRPVTVSERTEDVLEVDVERVTSSEDKDGRDPIDGSISSTYCVNRDNGEGLGSDHGEERNAPEILRKEVLNHPDTDQNEMGQHLYIRHGEIQKPEDHNADYNDSLSLSNSRSTRTGNGDLSTGQIVDQHGYNQIPDVDQSVKCQDVDLSCMQIRQPGIQGACVDSQYCDNNGKPGMSEPDGSEDASHDLDTPTSALNTHTKDSSMSLDSLGESGASEHVYLLDGDDPDEHAISKHSCDEIYLTSGGVVSHDGLNMCDAKNASNGDRHTVKDYNGHYDMADDHNTPRDTVVSTHQAVDGIRTGPGDYCDVTVKCPHDVSCTQCIVDAPEIQCDTINSTYMSVRACCCVCRKNTFNPKLTRSRSCSTVATSGYTKTSFVSRFQLDEKLAVLKNTSFLFYCFLLFTIPSANTATFIFLPGLAEERGVSDTKAAMLVSVIGASNALGTIVIGFIFDIPVVSRHRRLFHSSLGLMLGVTVLSMVFISGFVAMAVVSGWYGFALAGVMGQRATALSHYVTTEQLPSAFGFMIVFQGLGNLIGLTLQGYLKDVFSTYAACFYYGGILVSSASMLLNCDYIIRIILRKYSNTHAPKRSI